MLPEEKAVAEALLPEFRTHVKNAMRQALKIFEERETERDLEAPVWMKMPFGELSFATLSHTKTARICAALRTLAQSGYIDGHKALCEMGSEGPPSDDDRCLQVTDIKIDDELIDTINYCAFHWAYRRMMEQKPVWHPQGQKGVSE